jgi:hypothetical protein
VSLQVLMLTPSPGTKLYEGTFEKGLVLESVGGRKALPYMYDGNYVVASSHARPWRKQINLLLGYAFMYNPLWLAVALWPRKSKVGYKPAGMQIVGMIGLTQNIRRTSGWAIRMMFGRIRRLAEPPRGTIPLRGVSSEPPAHARASVISVPRSKERISLPMAG